MKLILIFLAIQHSLQNIVYKIGDRSEFITEEEQDDPTFSKYFDKYYTKTFDSSIYQYPLEVINSQINIGNLAPSLSYFEHYNYEKNVNENLHGLHREITYNLSFQIQKSKLYFEKLKNKKCVLAIIDYCDSGFYIEYEDVEKEEKFTFSENKRMDIEKMDSESPQYTFYMKFVLGSDDYKIEPLNGDVFINVNISKTLNYHLRYGQSNRAGKTLYKLPQSFDIVTNCFVKNFDEESLKLLINVPRYKWAFETIFREEKFSFFSLNQDRKVQNFVLPVGNTDLTFLIQVTTIILASYGMVVILFAVFFQSKSKINV